MAATTNETLRVLTPDQVQHYHQHGYLLIEGAVDAAWLERLQSTSDEFIEKSRELTPPRFLGCGD